MGLNLLVIGIVGYRRRVGLAWIWARGGLGLMARVSVRLALRLGLRQG